MQPGLSTICPRQLKGTPKGVISKDKLNNKTLYSTNTTYYYCYYYLSTICFPGYFKQILNSACQS